MDPSFLQWLTSTFGPAAPDAAAGLGVPPPGTGPGFGQPSVPGTAPQPTPEQMNGVGMPGGGNVWEPQPQQAMAQAAPQPAQGGNPLANALRGVAAPQVPAAQKVGTPSAPRQGDIKGGELLALLLAQGGGMDGGRKINPLPSTLGQALNAPRY